jgi:hypothetical protein
MMRGYKHGAPLEHFAAAIKLNYSTFDALNFRAIAPIQHEVHGILASSIT